jgi:hypothetical protein
MVHFNPNGFILDFHHSDLPVVRFGQTGKSVGKSASVSFFPCSQRRAINRSSSGGRCVGEAASFDDGRRSNPCQLFGNGERLFVFAL